MYIARLHDHLPPSLSCSYSAHIPKKIIFALAVVLLHVAAPPTVRTIISITCHQTSPSSPLHLPHHQHNVFFLGGTHHFDDVAPPMVFTAISPHRTSPSSSPSSTPPHHISILFDHLLFIFHNHLDGFSIRRTHSSLHIQFQSSISSDHLHVSTFSRSYSPQSDNHHPLIHLLNARIGENPSSTPSATPPSPPSLRPPSFLTPPSSPPPNQHLPPDILFTSDDHHHPSRLEPIICSSHLHHLRPQPSTAIFNPSPHQQYEPITHLPHLFHQSSPPSPLHLR